MTKSGGVLDAHSFQQGQCRYGMKDDLEGCKCSIYQNPVVERGVNSPPSDVSSDNRLSGREKREWLSIEK